YEKSICKKYLTQTIGKYYNYMCKILFTRERRNMHMKWLTILIGMIIWGYINGFFSSDKTANPWITDDERETKIKRKAIIASWSGVFMFCTINLLNKWLGIETSNTSPYLLTSVATILKENVELQILFMLFITYGIFYVYYRRKLSA
ncbi:hypothetical protein P3545_24475, partial [Vibrio parahaemolyticus]|nr:hypothetical protein [Vibrio parahaemolyticus]